MKDLDKRRSNWENENRNRLRPIGTGGTRKIADPPPRPCQHPEHNPPSMMVFEPGMYEHTCPQCGNTQRFTVSESYC